MPGPRPKPTALKLVTGNPGRRPLPKNEPKPRRVAPAPPERLSRGAMVAWGSLCERLGRLGVMTEMDVDALEQLCENIAEVHLLRADLVAHGMFEKITRTNGSVVTVPRAQYTALGDAERRLRAMLAEFGLTPSARTKVTAAPDEQPADPAAKYF